MKKAGSAIIILITAVLLCLTGCSSDFNGGSKNEASRMMYDGAEGYNDYYDEVSFKATGSEYEYTALAAAVSLNRKLIITNNMTIETLNYPETVALIKQKCAEMGGYIQESEERGIETGRSSKTRYAYLELRIPAEKFDSFMSQSGNFGNVISSNTSTNDITDEYFDKETRVATLKIQEERYLDLLTRAESMEDIITLEKALSEIRYQIESITGTLYKYDSLVNYTTVSVNVYEVYAYTEEEAPPAVTFGERISKQFVNSWKAFVSVCEFLLLAFVTLFPFLIGPAVILAVVLVIIRIKKKH